MQRRKGVNYLHVRLRRMVRAMIQEKKSVCSWGQLDKLRNIQQPFVLRLLSGLALVSCFSLFSYQTYDRVIFYLENPVTTDVYITKKVYQTFPDITICYQATAGTFQILQAYSIGDLCNTIPMKNAVLSAVKHNMSVIWEMMKTSTAIISAKEIERRISKNLTYSEVLLPYGTCTTFHTGSRISPEVDYTKMKIIFNFSNTTCAYKTGSMVYIHEHKEYPLFRHENAVRVGMKNEIKISSRKVNLIRIPVLLSD